MPICVIDNKRVDLTSDEWNLYQKIVKSYTTTTNKGEDLFIDLFETDENGIILFLKPPTKRQTSFEIIIFLMLIQQNQHLRLMHSEVESVCKQMKDKMREIDEKLQKIEKPKE